MTEPVAHAATHGAHGAHASFVMLTKKVGPLPLYAYVLILVAGAYAFRAYRQHSMSATDPLGSPAVSTPTPDGGASAGSSSLPTPGDGAGSVVVGRTNAQWALTVSNGMIAKGSSPATVSTAVPKYLAGGLLTAQERAIIITAVAAYGYPPQGVLPIKDVPVPKPPVTHPPVTHPPVTHPPVTHPPVTHPPAGTHKPKPPVTRHTYTVHSGDTLTSIAQHFYGSGSQANIRKIAAANHIANLNLIRTGQVLTIP